MGSVLTEPDGGRFPGVARSTGYGRRKSTAASIAASGCRRTGNRRTLRRVDEKSAGLEAAIRRSHSLPRGRQLVTLRDARDYIAKLPKAEHMTAEWQAAMFALMLVIDLNGPTMMARIGIMRALNRHVERKFNSDRKEKHWGKRELKRDR
jgi:hypothetical protein